MEQAKFQYQADLLDQYQYQHMGKASCDTLYDSPKVSLSASIFADRVHIRDTIRDDAAYIGFNLWKSGNITDLINAPFSILGDVTLVDCPVVDDAILAVLRRFDSHAANSGRKLVVCTSMEALDAVFNCLSQSDAQILVEPSRGEHVVALGHILAKMSNMRLRELSDEDRLVLVRLTEQVAQIAERLERMEVEKPKEAGSAFRFETPKLAFSREEIESGTARLVRKAKPPLPDPRLVRQVIRQRRARTQFFGADLFADPAWDILLDLTAARAEHSRVSITSLCIASGVPPTTALRWISQMVEAGLLHRIEDEADKRRAFIILSDSAAEAMSRYFMEMEQSTVGLV